MHKPNQVEFYCQHCDDRASGKAYRVFSDENGIRLLDMVVCGSCYDQARELGLDGEEITSDSGAPKELQVVERARVGPDNH